jgi:Cu+-exporting ATPase
MAGVEKAAVNFATEQAVVDFDPAAVKPERLGEKVRGTGVRGRQDRSARFRGVGRKQPSPWAE